MDSCENGKPRNTVATCNDCNLLPICNRRCSAHLSSVEQLNLGDLPSCVLFLHDLDIESISLLPVIIKNVSHTNLDMMKN